MEAKSIETNQIYIFWLSGPDYNLILTLTFKWEEILDICLIFMILIIFIHINIYIRIKKPSRISPDTHNGHSNAIWTGVYILVYKDEDHIIISWLFNI